MKRVYLDHAATTPARPEVVEAMLPFLGGGFNPSSLHAEGRHARAAVDAARETCGRLLGAKPREIVFTDGGTEADNLAILGIASARRSAGHVVTVATEHPAVLRACEALGARGWEHSAVGVDAEGRLAKPEFAAALRSGTVLASVMLANNEIGTLHPIADLAALAHERGTLFHTDAVAAAGRMPLDVGRLGVDLLALSAHKFGGPKGVGLLFVREGTPLAPERFGGGQENGLRAGTENVAGIVGLARAFELASAEQAAEAARLGRLRDRFESGLAAALPGVRVNGAHAPRVPGISSVAFPGLQASDMLARLDLEGFAVSAGSACAAGSTRPSHVLRAIGAPAWAARGTLRFSFGALTDEGDVEYLLARLPALVGEMRDEPSVLGTFSLGTESRSEVPS
jgi:cysteine desulfurase